MILTDLLLRTFTMRQTRLDTKEHARNSGSAGHLISAGVSGMDFASKTTLVDAMSGHPHVVTIGVREQVVKPATGYVGFFTMSSVATSFTPQRFSRLRRSACGFVHAAVLAAVIAMLQSTVAKAGSATAQFRVSARVVRSCHVSPQSLLEHQSVKPNVPINVKCDKNTASSISAPEPVRATVSYTWVDGSEESEGTKLVTLNF